ncbi:MAG TPA: hypothetical protein PKA06_09635 [Gemmatales bacterium]|nr:hypothetical protein [Gemmatales bacterium]HMP16377.1 hypothetical protein [Gemmatales bacterium]
MARLLGLFLLITAGLKIHALIVDPYGQDSFLLQPWMQLAVIEIEVLLGFVATLRHISAISIIGFTYSHHHLRRHQFLPGLERAFRLRLLWQGKGESVVDRYI